MFFFGPREIPQEGMEMEQWKGISVTDLVNAEIAPQTQTWGKTPKNKAKLHSIVWSAYLALWRKQEKCPNIRGKDGLCWEHYSFSSHHSHKWLIFVSVSLWTLGKCCYWNSHLMENSNSTNWFWVENNLWDLLRELRKAAHKQEPGNTETRDFFTKM